MKQKHHGSASRNRPAEALLRVVGSETPEACPVTEARYYWSKDMICIQTSVIVKAESTYILCNITKSFHVQLSKQVPDHTGPLRANPDY